MPRCGPGSNGDVTSGPTADGRISPAVLNAERRALLDLRERDTLGDALLHRLLHEVDLKEEYVALVRRDSEG